MKTPKKTTKRTQKPKKSKSEVLYIHNLLDKIEKDRTSGKFKYICFENQVSIHCEYFMTIQAIGFNMMRLCIKDFGPSLNLPYAIRSVKGNTVTYASPIKK